MASEKVLAKVGAELIREWEAFEKVPDLEFSPLLANGIVSQLVDGEKMIQTTLREWRIWRPGIREGPSGTDLETRNS